MRTRAPVLGVAIVLEAVLFVPAATAAAHGGVHNLGVGVSWVDADVSWSPPGLTASRIGSIGAGGVR